MKAKKAIRAAKTSQTGRGAGQASVPRRAVKGASPAAGGVEEYIAGISESSRKLFDALRAAAREAAPKDAEEVLSYGIVALRTDRVLVWYAAFAQHCSLFPTASVLGQFRDELKGYKVSKGTVQFPLEKPLPVALVKKLVRARVAEAGKKK
jgi:uncharacterized protein YdhG (YjbR/CyaY superfamily)